MTSKTASECFVYITLLGATSAVTAGKFVLGNSRTGDPLGKFVYGRSYLENYQAVPIDPVDLKLTDTPTRLHNSTAYSVRCAMPARISEADV